MKKMYKYILIITLMMFGFIGEVRADSKGINKCVDNGTCTLLCQYEYDNGNQYNIYFEHNNLDYRFSFGNGKLKKINTDTSGDVFIEPDAEKELVSGKCPKNLYYNDGFVSNEVCFDSYKSENGDYSSGYCMSTGKIKEKFKNGKDNSKEPTNVFKNEIIDNLGLNVSTKIPMPSCVKTGDCYGICYYEKVDKSHALLLYSNPSKDKGKHYSYSTMGLYSTGYQFGLTQQDFERFEKNYECPIFEKNENNVFYTFYYGDNANFDYKIYSINQEKKKEYKEKKEVSKNTEVFSCENVKEQLKSTIVNYDTAEVCGFDYVTDSSVEKLKQFFIINDDKKFSYYEARLDSNNKLILQKSNDDIEDISFEDSYTCSMYRSLYRKEKITIPVTYKWDSYNKNGVGLEYKKTCNIGVIGGLEVEEMPEIKDCESLLGVDLVNEINSLLLYIKIAVPIIIIVMGSIDFGTAFISSDEDKMKKAQKKFIMRIIIGMVIFFIPALVNALLNIANKVWFDMFQGTCGITF